jgi:hypothetical protein
MRWPSVLGLALVACGGESDPGDVDTPGASVPTDWVYVQANCGYGFQAPAELTAIDRQGEDSCLDSWSTPGCAYAGDHGSYSSNLSELVGQPQLVVREESIDGRAAKLVTALQDGSFVAAVNFPQVSPDEPGVRLTVSATCDDSAGQQDALRAFRTITFGTTAPSARP